MVKMTKNQMSDDISAFYNWKSSIERNEAPRKRSETHEMTASDLSRRLSVSTIVSDLQTSGNGGNSKVTPGNDQLSLF